MKTPALLPETLPTRQLRVLAQNFDCNQALRTGISKSRVAVLRAAAGLTLALWSKSPFAQPAPLPIYVNAQLPPTCQGVTDFGRRLLSRTQRLRWANEGEPGIVFEVSAQALPTGLVGLLQIRELNGRVTQRTVEGSTCDGVLDALAFVAAVLVEEPEPQPEPPSQPPRQAVAPAPEPEPIEWPDEAPRTQYEWGLGFTVGTTSATSDKLVQPNVGIRTSFAWTTRYLYPWIMVGFDQRFESTAHQTFANASVDSVFGGWALHAALSPIRWPMTGDTCLRPMATFEIGRLTASASNVNNVTVNPGMSKPWLAAGLGVSAETMLFPPVAALADLSLQMPLKRWDFYYQAGDGQDYHPFSVPSIGLNLRLGIILKF